MSAASRIRALLLAVTLLSALAVPASTFARPGQGDPPAPGKANPTLSTQASVDVPLGGSIADSATLTGGDNPTGTLRFEAYGPDDPTCDLTPAYTNTVSVSGAGTYPSGPFQPAAVGLYRWAVLYSGDSNNNSNLSDCNAPNESVNVGATTTGLASDNNPSLVGESVTFTATVASTSDASIPSGTVVFTIDGFGLSPIPLATDGTASLTTASLAEGPHLVWAQYFGDPSHAASGSSVLSQVVDKVQTNTQVSSNSNPSIIGAPVTFTATVTSVGDPSIPTGTVQFYVNGNPAAGPIVLDGSGQAALTTSFATRGTRNVTAVYFGDLGHFGSTSPVLRQVIARKPTAALAWVSPATDSRGTLFAFTATVSPVPPSTGTPGGAVRWFVDGRPVTAWWALQDGQRTMTRRLFLAVGDYDVTVRYRGTAKFLPSVSPVFELTIN